MAEAPSIDEILESLDHLLKEGTGKNDDCSGDASVPDAGKTPVLEPSPPNVDDASRPRRVLLSESMLVDNPQERLPFGSHANIAQESNNADPDDDDDAVLTTPARASTPDNPNIDELVRHISSDLVQRLYTQLDDILPGMVEDAVRRHLEGLRPEDKKT